VQNFNTAGSGTASGNARFTIARAVTGSHVGASSTSKYDEWETASTMKTFTPGSATSTNNYRAISAGPGQNEGSFSVPDNTQARQVKIDLQLNMNTNTGGASNSRGVKVKNISIIATSAFAGDFSTPGPLNVVR
jgi:hypothetical protein